jgi:eukaryotic-like serine/threonine-protein kinase
MAERFGEYELLTKIATGGMAEIYLARIGGVEGFSRRIVIKRMLPQLAVRPDFVEMFLDEARLAANLVHPNIVQVFNLGQVDGSYYMAMELIDGPHLGTLFAHSLRQRRPLPLELCVFAVARAADGLHYAHEQHDAATGQALFIVHRDISPQNILVSRYGDVKVTDFGVAKAQTQQSKTRTGIVKGKVSYMSPEQCLGEPVDRRTDVFALGVVLYELLTRRRLYREKSDLLVMQRITAEEPRPPSSLNPAIDNELDQIAVRALAKDRDDRFSSAADLSEALDIWLATQGHSDCRGQLHRWMEAHADDLGVGLSSPEQHGGTPSWERSGSRPATRGADDGGGTVSTPALDPAQGQASLSGRHPVVGNDDVDASTSRISAVTDAGASEGALPQLPLPGDALVLSAALALSDLRSVSPQDRVPRSKVPLFAALAVAAVVLVGVFFGLASGEKERDPVGEGARVIVVGEVTSPRREVPDPPAVPSAQAPPEPLPTVEVTQPGPPVESLAPAILVVVTVPPGVLVLVDGLPRGRSPARVELALDEPRQLEVQAVFTDQSPSTTSVRLEPQGEATVRLLAKVPLTVRSDPPGAQVFLGNDSVGTTPRESLLVEPGKKLAVAVVRAGYKKYVAELTPESGKPLVIDARLEKAAARPRPEVPPPTQPAAFGTLVVDSKPWGVVYVDGKKVGPTPVTLDKVRVGSRKVRVVNKNAGFDFAKTVNVEVKKDARAAVGFVWQKNGETYELERLIQ